MSIKILKVSIPWKYVISKNNKYTVWRRGQPALSKPYREAKDAIHKKSSEQIGRKKPFNIGVKAEFDMFPPDNRRRDILNYTQILCDGIEGVLYENDALINYVIVRRRAADKENPRVEIRVTEYGLSRISEEGDTDLYSK